MKNHFTLFILLLSGLPLNAQTINKLTSSTVSGTVCPGSATSYEVVSVPSGCQVVWSATNGQVTQDASNPRKASVVWADTPGASGTVKATFGSCSSEGNNGTFATRTELILSIKDQAWGSYGTSINIDYCTPAQVNVSVPRMFVQGTGGVGEPALTEVIYAWTLPNGWREVGTGRTGFFGTTAYFVAIEPLANNCSKPGNVTVYGTLVGAGPFCNSAANSATATIALNGVNPVATVVPQGGYNGSFACNTSPVTFYATTAALSCISTYNWTYPGSWSFVSQSGNSITLQPSGSSADSNPIKATITFTCGSSITSGNYVPTYAEPGISGPDYICTSGSYSVTNSSGVSVAWTSSNPSGLSIDPTTGQATRMNNFDGRVTLTASLNSGCLYITRNVGVGNYVPLGISSYNSNCSGNTFNVLNTSLSAACSANTSIYFSYQITDPNYSNFVFTPVSVPSGASWSFSGGYLYMTVNTPSSMGSRSATIALSATGPCGTLNLNFTSTAVNYSSYRFSISPNPSKEDVTVSMENEDILGGNSQKIYGIKIVDSFGVSGESFAYKAGVKSVKISLKDFSSGIYILSVFDGKIWSSERLIIKN
ncbi:MAG TPA: T9SS type A sorting domain-containing protein [Cyclobacteriaceae bacterium]|nr:T9SS type A sorting domain-containing protein [Cyclobacteriaceae bacterium]